jgi:hypothetical protein
MIPRSDKEGVAEVLKDPKAIIASFDGNPEAVPANTPPCVRVSTGWWTYEVCFHEKIRQFHLEPNGRITGENLVGNVDETKSVSSKGFLTEFYSGGTKCGNTPRSAKLIYQCNSKVDIATFAGIKEPSECFYEIYFDTPSLCTQYKSSTTTGAEKISCFESPLLSFDDLKEEMEKNAMKFYLTHDVARAIVHQLKLPSKAKTLGKPDLD